MVEDGLFHPASLVESDEVGAGTRVWAFAHVMEGAVVGQDCKIGDHAFVESGAVVFPTDDDEYGATVAAAATFTGSWLRRAVHGKPLPPDAQTLR